MSDGIRAKFSDARSKLMSARIRKIRDNIGRAPVPTVDEAEDAAQALLKATMAVQPLTHRRAAPVAHSTSGGKETTAVETVVMDDCRPPPTGLAWVRVRTSMRTPEGCEADYFVPYLGESDAHFQSSQNLAMELSSTVEQGDENDDGDSDHDNENDDLSDVEGKAPADDAPPRVRIANATLDRATKRVVIRDLLDRVEHQSRDSAARNIAKALGIRVNLVYAYYESAIRRAKMWAKVDSEAAGKSKMRDDLVLTAMGRFRETAAIELASDSITALFCRQCYTFDCMQHGIESYCPNVELLDTSRVDVMSEPERKRVHERCEKNSPGNCWFARARTEHIGGFSAGAPLPQSCMPLLENIRKHMGNDFCRIAEIIRTLDSSGTNIRCLDIGTAVQSQSTSLSSLKAAQRPKPPRALSKKMARGVVPPEEINAMMGGRRLDYTPCKHHGPCTPLNKDCTCAVTGVNCEKYCSCNHMRVSGERIHTLGQCPRSFGGCSCKSAASCMTNACVCFSTRRECDPDLCRACGAGNAPDEARGCCNVGLRLGTHFRTIVGRSTVHGWGVYAAEPIPRNVLIGEYVGEIVDQDEAERRGRVYDELDYSFLFNITEHYAVDSTRLGNKLKYCNHSSTPNCEPRLMRVSGDVRVGIYSKREIVPLEELFFDYGYNNGPAWAMRGKLSGTEDGGNAIRAQSKKRKRSMMKENPPARTSDVDARALPRTDAQSSRSFTRLGGKVVRRTSDRLASHLAQTTRSSNQAVGGQSLRSSGVGANEESDSVSSDESRANEQPRCGKRGAKSRAGSANFDVDATNSDSIDMDEVLVR
jgi:SET domain/CXC domain